MKRHTRNLRNHILSMRVSDDEWGVIHSCAVQRGARVSEVMRDALRMYMQRNVEHTYGKEF
jgi:hypothetical protein